MNQKKVAVIHTSFVSVDELKKLFKEILPQVQMINIVDDSILPEVIKSGQVTPSIVRRICNYAAEAEALGADAVLNQCSSVGEVAETARSMLNIPFIRIDEAMMTEAVKIGGRISIIATVASTLGPSSRLAESISKLAQKQVEIRKCLVDGALDILIKEGNVEKHNAMVQSEIERVQDDSDVIVLAQGSMVVLLPFLKHIKKPVLTSPRLGVEHVKKVLGLY
ncbi:MAG: aspartate/glutamate racemase family protein [Oscillospiraceae bacterium]|nr:aspartate/glutamate racemase family protein [Oscillospiraceae bacterium]